MTARDAQRGDFGRVMLTVDDEFGTAQVIVDTAGITKHQRKVVQQALADVVPDDLSERDRWMMLALLTRRIADEQAYERVCQERGLLL